MADPAPLDLLQTCAQSLGDASPSSKTLWLIPQAHIHDFDLFSGADICSPYKDMVDALAARGSMCLTDIPVTPAYTRVFILLPRQMDEAKFWIARALGTLQEGGYCAIAAANNAGGGRINGLVEEIGLNPLQRLAQSKSKGVLIQKIEAQADILSAWIMRGKVQQKMLDGIEKPILTQPGIFSFDRVDLASKMLRSYLPSLQGVGMDLGCGYGYLSMGILDDHANVPDFLYLVDHDCRALFCAQQNLEKASQKTTLKFIWNDARKPIPDIPPLDFIVMNPPFHSGGKDDPALGQAFIHTAAKHLKPRGVLWMVANRHLPYESVLFGLFAKVEMMAQDQGYKIFKAIKG